MSEYQLIHELLDKAHYDMLTCSNPCMKIFKGTENCVYYYTDSKGEKPFASKRNWTNYHFGSNSIFIEDFYAFLVEYTANLPAIKVARLQKKADGIRIRFDEAYALETASTSLEMLIAKAYELAYPSRDARTPEAEPEKSKPAQYVATEKKGNNMGDFSLSNLKDALVDKITHLDRKTVMILSIIALLLLIAGKYNTIKDILSGIKNKVKNSDNFKAMVTDGTNAINSLKKIVGVKGKGDADAEV